MTAAALPARQAGGGVLGRISDVLVTRHHLLLALLLLPPLLWLGLVYLG